MKKSLFFKFFVLAVIAVFTTVTSCKDYDDDINNLKDQIAGLSTTLNEIKGKVDAGAVITKVETTATGVKVTLSDGKTFDLTNGKDGKDGATGATGAPGATGAQGKPGSVVTANADGFWYIDGVKSAYTWKGEKGDTGATGAQGPAGKDGIYFVPNADGYWYKVENGVQTKTNDLWLLPGVITAVVNEKGDVTFNNVKSGTSTNSITFYKSKVLRSMTFIPDYTSTDGTPQIVVRGLKEWEGPKSKSGYTGEYWAAKTSGKIYKGVTVLKYNLSPSDATLDDFDVVGFLHDVTLVRSSSVDDYLVLTDEATVENGVLSVPVLIGENNYPVANVSDGQSKNHSVALQVKITDEGEDGRLVTSTQYVKVNFDLETGRIALNASSTKTPGTLLPYDIDYATIAAGSYAADVKLWNGKGQGGNADNPALAETNLNDYIYGVFGNPVKKMLDYGFNKHVFKFRLVNLVSEGTAQSSDYVTLDQATGILKVKPVGSLVNQAAVGRTPVVEVTAVVDGKVYAVGYIKVIITDQFDASDINFNFTLPDYELGCNSTYSLTDVALDAIDFDQVFNHVRIQLGKDAFFQEYRQTPMTVTAIVPPTPANATVGYNDATKHVSFSYAINPATQSVNLYNYLKGDIRNDAPNGTYKVTTRLKSNGYRPDVVITWNFKVTLPTNIKLTDNTAILSGNKVIVNPTILEQGGKTSAAYESLLNNAFMHQSNAFVYTGLSQACEAYLTPYFVFTTVPSGYYVSADGKQVLQTGTNALAARIEQDGLKFYVRLNYDIKDYPGASWDNYTPLSAAAKGLVGQSVSVQPRGYINSVTYNWVNLRNPFEVQFVYPLNFVLPTDASVYDQANQGLNVYTLNLYSPNTALVDWNGAKLDITTTYGRQLINHYEVGVPPVSGTQVISDWVFAGLIQAFHPGSVSRPGFLGYWYAPVTAPTVTYNSPFVFDPANAKCNINGAGQIVSDINYAIPAGMKLKIDAVAAAGSTTVVVGGTTYNLPTTFAFTWENGATGAVQNDFKIAVPVQVTHKWGVLKSNLVINVKKGSGN